MAHTYTHTCAHMVYKATVGRVKKNYSPLSQLKIYVNKKGIKKKS